MAFMWESGQLESVIYRVSSRNQTLVMKLCSKPCCWPLNPFSLIIKKQNKKTQVSPEFELKDVAECVLSLQSLN